MSKRISEPMPAPIADLTIGSVEDSFFFLGHMSGVRLSDVARYSDDYAPEPTPSLDAATKALWRFDEGQGAVELRFLRRHTGQIPDRGLIAAHPRSVSCARTTHAG